MGGNPFFTYESKHKAMKANKMEEMIAKLETLDERGQKRLLAAIKHQALIEIRNALRKPVYC
jgi:hypothetical protein